MRTTFSIIGCIVLGCGIFINPLGFTAETADLLLHNGKILAVDGAFSIYSAMAIQGDRILAVGSDAQLQALRGPNTQVIDLQGKTVLPGLIDSHTHPSDACLTEFDHPIPQMDSIPDVLNYIKTRAQALKPGEWILVSQVFLTRLKEERYPTRQELDDAAPNHPVIFRTGPDASVNTLALKLSGIDKNWKVDDGGPGYTEKDPQTGELNGILRSCTRYLKYKSPEKSPTLEAQAAKLKELFADYNRVGITAVGERDADDQTVQLYKMLKDRGELNMRAFLSHHVETIPTIEKIREAIETIAQDPLVHGDSLLRIGAIKVYLDGGMLTGSAYMLKPWGVSKIYNISDPNYRGVCFIPQEKLVQIIDAAMNRNLQFNAHTVGDGAVTNFIDACAALKDRHDLREKRPVICHSNFMSEDACRRAAELGVCMDIQPAWLNLDGRTLQHHFGYERLAWFQPLRTLFALGAIAGGGSDHMQKIGSLRSNNFYDPWLAMWTTMTRQAKWLDQPLHPEQALSRVEAIRFYTNNNAYLQYAERERGSLEPGKLADFIIVNEDILTCPVDQFKEIHVDRTYIGGKCVYKNQV